LHDGHRRGNNRHLFDASLWTLDDASAAAVVGRWTDHPRERVAVVLLLEHLVLIDVTVYVTIMVDTVAHLGCRGLRCGVIGVLFGLVYHISVAV
jgi:hypothetical protein